jgi:hypothetical protein
MQLAREVNEAIVDIGRKFEVGDVGLDFFCECGAEECLDRLSLTVATFDGFRSTSEPVLADGHPVARAPEPKARAWSTQRPVRSARSRRRTLGGA